MFELVFEMIENLPEWTIPSSFRQNNQFDFWLVKLLSENFLRKMLIRSMLYYVQCHCYTDRIGVFGITYQQRVGSQNKNKNLVDWYFSSMKDVKKISKKAVKSI